jgi:hypothetical protein
MQALDSLIYPIPGFDSDVLILAIPISTRPPGNEFASDPFVGASASTIKTQVGKCNVTANPTALKKANKAAGRSSSGIKINEPVSNVPALTPPSGPQQRIPIN